MTKGTFSAAINKIDLAYVSESLNYSKNNIKTNIKRSTILKIASVAACFAIVLVSVLAITMRKTPVEGNISTDEFGQEMIVAPVASGKATTGHKIGIKCYSFYPENTINLDVFMSQRLFESEKEKINGYPVLKIEQETGDYTETGTVQINGNNREYEKRFSLNDLSYLVADSAVADVFDGHRENVNLDFTGIKTGETSTVTFSYGFFYYTDNPYNESQRDNSWCGMKRTLYFYCGENGVSVSSTSVNDAISNYENINKKLNEHGHEPDTDVNC